MTEWGFELGSICWPLFWPLSPNCFPVGDSPSLIGSPRIPLPGTSSPPSLYLTVFFSFIPHLSSPLSGSPCFSSVQSLSRVRLFAPGDLSEPETEPRSPSLQAVSLLTEPPGNSSVIILCASYIFVSVRLIS